MIIDKKKIINILEYVLLFFVCLIGIKKGGYYKADTVVSVFLIEIISLVIFILNIRDIKKNSVMSLVLLIFSLAYFLPVFINSATVSGALNIWTRVYVMYLIFMIVQNSEKKKKFLNALVLFTVIFNLLGIDEIYCKWFENALSYLGSGYIEETQRGITSVLQYSNLLGILNTICAVYIVDKLIQRKAKNEEIVEFKEDKFKRIIGIILRDIKEIGIYVLIGFIDISVLLVESKMGIVLFLISQILLIVLIHKNKKQLLFFFVRLIYAFVIYSIAIKFNPTYAIYGLISWIIYGYALRIKKVKEKEGLLNLSLVILSCIIGMIGIAGILDNGIIWRIIDYFQRFSSTNMRSMYFLDGLKIAVMTPLNFVIGMGGNAFRTMYEVVQSQEYISLEVHGFFIQILIESGIIGLISIIVALAYSFIKGKNDKDNNVYKLMLAVLVIYAAFDVFNTYFFMMLVLAFLLGVIEYKKVEMKKVEKIINGVWYLCVFGFSAAFFVAYAVEPIIVNNIEVGIERQEKNIKYLELASKIDPWDFMYRENTITGLHTYLHMLENEENKTGILLTEKKKEVIKKMYENAVYENKCEKENKYMLYDEIDIMVENIDTLVQIYYPEDVHTGYEIFLEKIVSDLERLKNNHEYNELAQGIRDQYAYNALVKFEDTNRILRSEKITIMLKSLEDLLVF